LLGLIKQQFDSSSAIGLVGLGAGESIAKVAMQHYEAWGMEV